MLKAYKNLSSVHVHSRKSQQDLKQDNVEDLSFFKNELVVQLVCGILIFLAETFCYLEISEKCVRLEKSRWDYSVAVFNGTLLILAAIHGLCTIARLCSCKGGVLCYGVMSATSSLTCAVYLFICSWKLGRQLRQLWKSKPWQNPVQFGIFYQLILVLICAVAVLISFYTANYLFERCKESRKRRRQNALDRKREHMAKVQKVISSSSNDEPAVLEELIHEERLLPKKS